MIKKLRIKFVLLSMTAFAVVLMVIIAGINIVNFNGVVREADELLDILSENKGMFPGDFPEPGGQFPPGMSPEIPYESRYFSVILNERNGAVIQVDTSRIAAVDTGEAIRRAQDVLEGARSRGFVEQFRYSLRTENGFLRIIFLDCGRKLDAFRSFLLASVAITLIGYLAVFALIVFFSGRVIRPISESYEKQRRFITDAGHEIKTPLTIISADADVLEMEVGENEWLEDIRRQAKRLTALTNDLVTLSRMEEPENKLPMADFPFSGAVSRAASSFQAPAQTQGKVFLCDIQPMLTLRGNEKAIGQLVDILLDNALKYSPAGGTVSLTAERQGRGILLSVANTTQAPIPKESLPLLFDRFYRTDPSRNSETGGHGIGLSIAKAIVTAHNGKIQAVSEEDHSLRITVTLPV